MKLQEKQLEHTAEKFSRPKLENLHREMFKETTEPKLIGKSSDNKFFAFEVPGLKAGDFEYEKKKHYLVTDKKGKTIMSVDDKDAAMKGMIPAKESLKEVHGAYRWDNIVDDARAMLKKGMMEDKVKRKLVLDYADVSQEDADKIIQDAQSESESWREKLKDLGKVEPWGQERMREAKKDDLGNPPFYLVDLKRGLYDDKHAFNTFEIATRANLAIQIGSGNDYIVPLSIDVIKKQRLKPGKIDIYQPVERLRENFKEMKIKASDLKRGNEVDMPIEHQGDDERQKQRAIRFNKSTNRYELYVLYDYAHKDQEGKADYSYSALKDLVRNTNQMFHMNDVAVEDTEEEAIKFKPQFENPADRRSAMADGVPYEDMIDKEAVKLNAKLKTIKKESFREKLGEIHEQWFAETVYFVLRGLSGGKNDKPIKDFFKKQGWGNPEFVTEWKTLPGQGGAGGRSDALFKWEGSSQEMGKFAVQRFGMGGKTPSWHDDYLDNDDAIIPDKIKNMLKSL